MNEKRVKVTRVTVEFEYADGTQEGSGYRSTRERGFVLVRTKRDADACALL